VDATAQAPDFPAPRAPVWLLGTGIAVSVLAGDIRAMLGSVGLVGLALSWALQTPIESFTGWLLNSFQGYYRVGDRVQVGDVFGDVYAIDFLSTTLWELGSAERPGAVHADQPTGRLITFPNQAAPQVEEPAGRAGHGGAQPADPRWPPHPRLPPPAGAAARRGWATHGRSIERFLSTTMPSLKYLARKLQPAILRERFRTSLWPGVSP
jgi:hypothetical protein